MRAIFNIAIILLLLLLSGCAAHREIESGEGAVLRIKGSDSMLLLVQRLSEEYMKRHADRSISVEGGGSGIGIQALINGSIDICTSSRPLEPDEVSRIAQRYNSLGVSILCAKDALSIIVHPTNPLSTLSMKSVQEIFSGAIVRWNSVGGNDVPITVYTRESNSGTHLYFDEHVLMGNAYSEASTIIPGARGMINAVAGDSTAIGYSTLAYVDRVKSVSVNGIAPTPENVRNGTYPISRYLYFYTIHPPEGTIKAFIDWVIGPEGQKIAKANGYIPLYDVQ